MANNNEAVALLRSIDSSLKQLVRHFAKAAPVEIADDRDLDGKYGDPELKFLPRDWRGADYKGYRFSECPADLLDLVASAFDYFARKAEETNETYNGKPVAPYKRKDAARARGWAARHRKNGGPTKVNRDTGEIDEPAATGFDPSASEWPTEDDIPF